MANRIDIEVSGCKGCPFAHHWSDGHYRVECKLEEYALNSGDVREFALTEGRAPDWCPLRQDSVRVDFTGRG